MMKRTLCALAVVLMTSGAFAQTLAEKWRDGTNTVRGLVGMTQTSMNVGLDYERRMGNAGVGGFFIWSDENDDIAAPKPEQMIAGAQAVIHVIDNTAFDVYVAPGIAAVVHDDLSSTPADDGETSFGPSLRLGTVYYFNQNWGLGFDWLKTTNWFSDDVGYQEEMTNLAVSYTY